MSTSEYNKIIRNFANTLKDIPNRKTSPYDTQAEVIRIEGNTAWVHIPGGVDETPVQLTINAKEGDIVQVRISGGTAWLYGNSSNPPTDDTTAVVARQYAVEANDAAEEAQEVAADASEAADQAWIKAGEAEDAAIAATDSANTAKEQADKATESANDAQTQANNATQSAVNANGYARAALSSLSDVEQVVDVIGWVSEHGSYSPTQDISVDSNKSYYRLLSETNTYERVPMPISTYITDMYELEVSESYFKTNDESVDAEKTYYIYDSVNEIFVAVVSPVDVDLPTYFEKKTVYNYSQTQDTSPVSGKDYYAYDYQNNTYFIETPTSTIGQYYELSFNESIRNYILTHVAIDDSGMSIFKDDSAYSILITGNNIQLKNEIGKVIATYGSEIELGNEFDNIRAVISQVGMHFKTPVDDIAYFGMNDADVWEMFISNASIDDMLRFGDYAWITRNNGNMTLKWLGGV